MKRRHQMPFGAAVTDSGVRFRLWAPAADTVELCLEGGVLPLPATGGGWFELHTGQASAGSRYHYRIDGQLQVPDPASRFNPDDVHGASEVIDPAAFDWQDDAWYGRPWHEAVIYELHVGSFSPQGGFAGVEEKLDHLVSLGVTAIELMPVADFPGQRNWGYDGVLPFAPDASYGRPDDLKRLVQSAHRRGLMVLLDVVYNHFGPEGNYLHTYADAFFTDRHQTPWGAAINFDAAGSEVVREFFIHNALYWLEEYHLDGLRLDAVHAIQDDSAQHILAELEERVRSGPGRERHVHLVLENDNNDARYLDWGYDAQWNDDIHHSFHALLTGESDGYYHDYAQQPITLLGRCLAEGFAYQGDPSPYRRGERRGQPSAYLPPTRFISFLQNHDQIGNRAFGERLTELAQPDALRAAIAILLLAPSPPLLFMGEEWGTRRRFPFFCDFGPELAQAVTAGRRREFAHFERFQDPRVRETIPDPNAAATFAAAQLDWEELKQPLHAEWLAYYRQLLALRRRKLAPRLVDMPGGSAEFGVFAEQGLRVRWVLSRGERYDLVANLSAQPLAVSLPGGEWIYASPGVEQSQLPPWSVVWSLEE
jgi:malto-oligosyltrehalose trehalohydrolase